MFFIVTILDIAGTDVQAEVWAVLGPIVVLWDRPLGVVSVAEL